MCFIFLHKISAEMVSLKSFASHLLLVLKNKCYQDEKTDALVVVAAKTKSKSILESYVNDKGKEQVIQVEDQVVESLCACVEGDEDAK